MPHSGGTGPKQRPVESSHPHTMLSHLSAQHTMTIKCGANCQTSTQHVTPACQARHLLKRSPSCDLDRHTHSWRTSCTPGQTYGTQRVKKYKQEQHCWLACSLRPCPHRREVPTEQQLASVHHPTTTINTQRYIVQHAAAARAAANHPITTTRCQEIQNYLVQTHTQYPRDLHHQSRQAQQPTANSQPASQSSSELCCCAVDKLYHNG